MITIIGSLIGLIIIFLIFSLKWYEAQECYWGLNKFGKYLIYEEQIGVDKSYYAKYLAGKVLWIIPIWVSFKTDPLDKKESRYSSLNSVIEDLQECYRISDIQLRKIKDSRRVSMKKFCDFLDYLLYPKTKIRKRDNLKSYLFFISIF